MEWVFLAVGVASLLTTINAIRPVPWTVVSIFSFFGGWLATELAIHRAVIQILIVIAFVWLGALDTWQGIVGVLLMLPAILGTLYLVAIARGAGEVAEQALKEGLGADYLEHIDPDLAARHDPTIPWARLLLPFRMGLPEVERIKNLSYGPYGRRNKLDVYRHKDRPAKAPILFQIHGGGWVIGNKDQQGIPLMQHLASRVWLYLERNY